jgi:Uncharacterized conserved protein
MEKVIAPPDITHRPYHLLVEQDMQLPAEKIFRAWTEQIDSWFAVPGSVLMKLEVNSPFFWEVEANGEKHPHYGRFLQIDKDKLIEHTWVTPSTLGRETILRLELSPAGQGTHVKLTHSGFPDLDSMRQHEEAWPGVLHQLEQRIRGH